MSTAAQLQRNETPIQVMGVERHRWRHDADILVITAMAVPSVADLTYEEHRGRGAVLFVSTERTDGFASALAPLTVPAEMGPFRLLLTSGEWRLIHNARLAPPMYVSQTAGRELVRVIVNGAPAAFDLKALQATCEPLGIPIDLRMGRVPHRYAVPKGTTGQPA